MTRRNDEASKTLSKVTLLNDRASKTRHKITLVKVVQ